MAGSAFEGRGYSPEASGFFWRGLEKALFDAARITVYGASRRIGRPIQELSNAWDLRIREQGPDTKAGGMVFSAYLPSLGEAVPKLFEQQSLFGDDLNPEDTVFDWLGDVTSAVWQEQRGSDRLDTDLLRHLTRFRNAPKGFESASIVTRRYRHDSVCLNQELGGRAERLVNETPKAQRTRIKGTLNQIAYVERGLLLNLSGGARLRVLWDSEDVEALRGHWGHEVLLEGVLQYKPNGQPQVLVADSIRAATSQDGFWKDLPQAIHRQERIVGRDLMGGKANPLERLRGVLDGDIDDDTFSRMMEEFSRS